MTFGFILRPTDICKLLMSISNKTRAEVTIHPEDADSVCERINTLLDLKTHRTDAEALFMQIVTITLWEPNFTTAETMKDREVILCDELERNPDLKKFTLAVISEYGMHGLRDMLYHVWSSANRLP